MTGFDWERAKKRARFCKSRIRRGSEIAGAKLDDEKVRLLRSGECNLHELARRWDVDRKTLRDARDGKTWAYIRKSAS